MAGVKVGRVHLRQVSSDHIWRVTLPGSNVGYSLRFVHHAFVNP